MRTALLLAVVVAGAPGHAGAQLTVELLYGADRNVQSVEPETDGWLNATVEWRFRSGLGLGIGTDHHFETASPDPAEHEGWAIYLSASHEFSPGVVAPFLRGGVGLGRAPCSGDVCTDGAYVRGSAGARVRVTDRMRAAGELGVSRVSRPFGGVGIVVAW